MQCGGEISSDYKKSGQILEVNSDDSSLSLKERRKESSSGLLTSELRLPPLESLLVMTSPGFSCPPGTGLGS